MRLLLVIVLILTGNVQAQKGGRKKPPSAPKAQQNEVAKTGYPVRVLTAGIGIHRGVETSCPLVFKNDDLGRAITYVQWRITAKDIVTNRETGKFYAEAETPAPIKPGQNGLALAILNESFPMTNCREYEPLKIGQGNGSFFVFFPNICTVDWLIIDITKVRFEDGSEWEPPGRFFPVK